MTIESIEAKILQVCKEKYPESDYWGGNVYLNLNTELLDTLLPGLGLNNGEGGKITFDRVYIENENE